MDANIVTVGTYTYALQAEFAQQVLKDAGIESWLNTTDQVATDSIMGAAIGMIELMVREDDAERATEILEEEADRLEQEDAEEAPDESKCLACGEPMTEEQTVCPKCGWSFGAAEPSDQTV